MYRIVFLFNEMLNIIQNRLIKCLYFHFKYGIQNIYMLNYNFNLVAAVALKNVILNIFFKKSNEN